MNDSPQVSSFATHENKHNSFELKSVETENELKFRDEA